MDDKPPKASHSINPPPFKQLNLLQSPSLFTSFFTPPTSPNDLQKFRSLYPIPQIHQFETPLTVKRFEQSSQKKFDSNNASPMNQNYRSPIFTYGSPKENNNGNMIMNTNSSPQGNYSFNESPSNAILQKRETCNCRKSQCLKLYCECFSTGEVCGNSCSCSNCHNNKRFIKERNEMIETILSRQPEAFNSKFERKESAKEVKHKKGCNCRKSNCLKKYCECLREGVACSLTCKCADCKNVVRNDEIEEIERTVKKRKLNPKEEGTIIKGFRNILE